MDNTIVIHHQPLHYSFSLTCRRRKPGIRPIRTALCGTALRQCEYARGAGGGRYHINWVYKREGLPVEIIREFEQWREIRDSDGTVGWVHKQMLQSKRAVVIRKGIAVMRKSPDMHANPVLRAEPGVIGKLISCEPDWCKVQIADHKGWIPQKTAIWGVYKNEKF